MHKAQANTFSPYGLQLTRLLCPWDSPGKNTGMGEGNPVGEGTTRRGTAPSGYPQCHLKAHTHFDSLDLETWPWTMGIRPWGQDTWLILKCHQSLSQSI